MKDSEEFRGEMFWIYYGAEIVIMTFAIIASIGAFVQVLIYFNKSPVIILMILVLNAPNIHFPLRNVSNNLTII